MRFAVVQDGQARQGFALEQVSRAATEVGEAAIAMPGLHTFHMYAPTIAAWRADGGGIPACLKDGG